MKEKTSVFLFGVVILFVVHGLITTIQMRSLENRVAALDKQLAHVFEVKVEKVASSR